MMLFWSSSTWVRVWSDWSEVMLTLRSEGRNSALASAMMRLISSEAMMRFSPARFLTSSETTGLPHSRAKLVASWSTNWTVATSRR